MKKLRKKHHFPKNQTFFIFLHLIMNTLVFIPKKHGKRTETKENNPEKQMEIDAIK